MSKQEVFPYVYLYIYENKKKLLLNISDFKNSRVTNNNKSFQSFETLSFLHEERKSFSKLSLSLWARPQIGMLKWSSFGWKKKWRRLCTRDKLPLRRCGETRVHSRNQNVIFFNNKSTVLYIFTRRKWSLISFRAAKEGIHLMPCWKMLRKFFRLQQLAHWVNSTIVSCSSSWVPAEVENVWGYVREFVFKAENCSSSHNSARYEICELFREICPSEN